MRRAGILGAFALLVACSEPEPPPPVVAAPPPPECYTVKVFSSTKIKKPGAKLPDAWKAFSGVWGKAGWDGTWCHEIYILEIAQDGTVTIMDTHGPGGQNDATAFRRTGKIDDNGRLTFRADGILREYWVENGMLRGVKHLSDVEKSEIVMSRKS